MSNEIYMLFLDVYIERYYDEVPRVCKKCDRLRMQMESTNFLGIQIE